MKGTNIAFCFAKRHKSLTEVLTDHDLASLGDAYINFVCSLALSNKRGKPSSVKVKGSMLAEALRKAGLREHLPARMSRHMLADAAEALMVYAWLDGYLTLEETVGVLEKTEALTDGLCRLLFIAKDRAKFS